MAAHEADTLNFFSIILGMKVETPEREMPSVTMLREMNKKQGLLSSDRLVCTKCFTDLLWCVCAEAGCAAPFGSLRTLWTWASETRICWTWLAAAKQEHGSHDTCHSLVLQDSHRLAQTPIE